MFISFIKGPMLNVIDHVLSVSTDEQQAWVFLAKPYQIIPNQECGLVASPMAGVLVNLWRKSRN